MYNPKTGPRLLSDFVIIIVSVEFMVDWRGHYDCCDKSDLQPSFKVLSLFYHFVNWKMFSKFLIKIIK